MNLYQERVEALFVVHVASIEHGSEIGAEETQRQRDHRGIDQRPQCVRASHRRTDHRQHDGGDEADRHATDAAALHQSPAGSIGIVLATAERFNLCDLFAFLWWLS